MAEMTIRLRCDPQTGKRDIVVQLQSDADATPQEHEQLHRSLVERLIEGGVLKAGEAGRLIVEREAEKGTAARLPVGEPASPEGRAASETS
jgi:hypothetical protein